MVAATLTETLKDALTLTQAAGFFARRPHIATMHRWAATGTRGVKLQTWLMGGVRVTTPDAIEAFLRQLNAAAEPVADDAGRRARDAGKALEAVGA